MLETKTNVTIDRSSDRREVKDVILKKDPDKMKKKNHSKDIDITVSDFASI